MEDRVKLSRLEFLLNLSEFVDLSALFLQSELYLHKVQRYIVPTKAYLSVLGQRTKV